MARTKRGFTQHTFDPYWRRLKPGPKPSRDSGVPHLRRAGFEAKHPVHVTLKLRRNLPLLRRTACYGVICYAFDAAKERPGRLVNGEFRLIQYSVQNDHLHLVVEAKDRLSLSRGVQGLCVRIARGLNRLWSRRGKVFADRYHDRVLGTLREVRNVLAYVLNNDRRHGRRLHRGKPDCFSSGPWFGGWEDYVPDGWMGLEPPIVAARSWWLVQGWRRHGLLSLAEVPGRRRASTAGRTPGT